jgi:hypothetical protein
MDELGYTPFLLDLRKAVSLAPVIGLIIYELLMPLVYLVKASSDITTS